MALIVHPARAQPVKNMVLALASVVFSLVIAEAAVRYIDGYAMFEFPLNKPVGSMTAGQELIDQVPLASSVEREWFLSDPPALPATLANNPFSVRRPAGSSPTTRPTATPRRLIDTFQTPRFPADW